MTDDFESEIRKLAEKSRKRSGQTVKAAVRNHEADTDFRAVLEEFLRVSKVGAKVFNDSVNEESLRVYKLPTEFLEIFLGILGRRGGLAIAAPQRLAIFFDEDPNVITVIGKLRSNDSGMQASANKSLQLIKISVSNTDIGYEYRDNTGKTLDAEGIISVVIGWLVQA